jgi:exo-beta-1,3-glucanase (GH17 family)
MLCCAYSAIYGLSDYTGVLVSMVHCATAVCAMHWYQGAASTTATSATATTSTSRLITATTGGVLSQYNAAGDCDGTYDVGTGIRAMASDGHIIITACIDDTLRYYIIVT